MVNMWVQEFKVTSFQVDRNNRISMHALSGLLQEAAGEHAITLGFGYEDMIIHNWVWVLSRLKIKVFRLPRWREKIVLRTWVVERQRMLSRRDFEILDGEGRRLIVAVTMWALLDIKVRRPIVLEKVDFGFPYRPEERVMDEEPGKLLMPKGAEIAGNYRVRYSDIDMNGHMNNVHYVRIVVDSYPVEWLDTHLIKELEVNYRAEARLNDELIIKNSTEEDVFLHQVLHKRDDRPVALVKINWAQI